MNLRGVYFYKGVYQRKLNFWGHARKIPECFYEGKTDIAPAHVVIKRVISNAYSHHIERTKLSLMFLAAVTCTIFGFTSYHSGSAGMMEIKKEKPPKWLIYRPKAHLTGCTGDI